MPPSNSPSQPNRIQNTTSPSSLSQPLRNDWSDAEINRLLTFGYFPGRSLNAVRTRCSIESRARACQASQARGGSVLDGQRRNGNGHNTGAGVESSSPREYIYITDSEDENDAEESGTAAVESSNVNTTPTKKNMGNLSTPVASPFPYKIQKNGWAAYRNYPWTPTSVETSAGCPQVDEEPTADSDLTLTDSPSARTSMKRDSASATPSPLETPKSRFAVHEQDIPAVDPSHDHPEIESLPGQLNTKVEIDADQPKTQLIHNHRDILNLQRKVLRAQRRARRAEERYHKRARRAEELERELDELKDNLRWLRRCRDF
ncbi:hypothetical protein BDW69DRAFT_189320 [Aspergillus filifer]